MWRRWVLCEATQTTDSQAAPGFRRHCAVQRIVKRRANKIVNTAVARTPVTCSQTSAKPRQNTPWRVSQPPLPLHAATR